MSSQFVSCPFCGRVTHTSTIRPRPTCDDPECKRLDAQVQRVARQELIANADATRAGFKKIMKAIRGGNTSINTGKMLLALLLITGYLWCAQGDYNSLEPFLAQDTRSREDR